MSDQRNISALPLDFLVYDPTSNKPLVEAALEEVA